MNLMIDLETLDIENSAVVLSIGAVFFDEEGIHEEFYRELDAQAQIDLGRSIRFDTLQWWLTQKGMFPESCGKTKLAPDLAEFVGFCNKYEGAKVWGNGATFDISMMESLFKSTGIVTPWDFWNIRDVRTIVDLYPESRGGFQNNHNALDDAKAQADWVIKAWEMHGGEPV